MMPALRPHRRLILLLAVRLLGGPAAAQSAQELQRATPVIGLPCEGCEAVFQELPDLGSLGWAERIAPAGEPGEPMRIEGTVYRPDGQPAPGVVVYAYHTDARGIYPTDAELTGFAARHGRLRAWARADSLGRYRFDSIRPGSYPDRSTPAHVHMHVIEPGCCTYWIDSIHFADDPLLAADHREPDDDARGGPGLVRPSRTPAGVWLVRRDIHLGRGVPGYPGG